MLFAIPAHPRFHQTARLIAMQDEATPTFFSRKPWHSAHGLEAFLRRFDPIPLPHDETFDKKKWHKLGRRYCHLSIGSDRDTERLQASPPTYADHLAAIFQYTR